MILNQFADGLDAAIAEMVNVVAAQVKEVRIETIFRYAHVFPRALSLMGEIQLTNALRALEEQRLKIEQGLEPLRVRIGDLNYIATSNATLGAKLDDLLDAPVRPGVWLRDVATIETGTDIVTGYAHVNGKRTVYIQVTKRADASTVAVLNRVPLRVRVRVTSSRVSSTLVLMAIQCRLPRAPRPMSG